MKSRNLGFKPQPTPGYGNYGPYGYAYPGQGFSNYGVSPAFAASINDSYMQGRGYSHWGPYG